MHIQIFAHPDSLEHSSHCANLYKAAFSEAGTRIWDKKEFLKILDRPSCILLMTPVSFILADVVERETEIIIIAVHPEKWRQSHGTEILSHFFDFCRRAGLETCTLEVADDNNAAKNLYSKFNFENIGIRKKYYRRKSGLVSAIIMQKRFF